jgi:hypothetical protein
VHASILHFVKYDPTGTSTIVVPLRTMVPAPDALHGSLRPGSADAVPGLHLSHSSRLVLSDLPCLPCGEIRIRTKKGKERGER